MELTGKAGARQAVDIRKGLAATVEEVRSVIGTQAVVQGDDLCDAAIALSDAKAAVHTAMALWYWSLSQSRSSFLFKR